jgi:hypothetical protein
MRDRGIEHLEPLFLPSTTLGENDQYPGWHTKMGQVEAVIDNKKVVYPVSRQLPGIWVLFDTTPRQHYSRIKEPAWNNDPLADVLGRARESGLIGNELPDELSMISYLPLVSRFGLSTPEQDEIIFPELAKKLGLSEQVAKKKIQIRRPFLAEFNYIGNNIYPDLAIPNTWEFMQDTFTVNNLMSTVVGGSSRFGGLAHAGHILNRFRTDARGDAIGFRAVITFN